MKEVKTRIIKCLIAALILIIVPVTQAKAETFNKTKDDAVAWCKSLFDKPGEDVDKAAGVQCVDLARKYTQWLGKDIGRCAIKGIAADYGTQSIPTAYYTRYGNSVKPQPGDLFIWDVNKYGAKTAGHVGIIYEVGSNYYKYVDYAPSRGSTAQLRGAKSTTKKDGLYNFSWIIRPNFKNPKPEPKRLNVATEAANAGVSVDNGVFRLVSALGDGYYSISDPDTGLALTASGEGLANHTNIEFNNVNNSDSQKWIIKNVQGSGIYI